MARRFSFLPRIVVLCFGTRGGSATSDVSEFDPLIIEGPSPGSLPAQWKVPGTVPKAAAAAAAASQVGAQVANTVGPAGSDSLRMGRFTIKLAGASSGTPPRGPPRGPPRMPSVTPSGPSVASTASSTPRDSEGYQGPGPAAEVQEPTHIYYKRGRFRVELQVYPEPKDPEPKDPETTDPETTDPELKNPESKGVQTLKAGRFTVQTDDVGKGLMRRKQI